MQRACAASKVGCTGFKMRKLALTVGKDWGGIARTPPGVNVHPLMWPGELINSECSPGCSSRQPGARIYKHTGPQFNRLGGQSAASSFRGRFPRSASSSRSAANRRSSLAISGARKARSRREAAASRRNIVTSFRMIPIEQGSRKFSFVPSSLAIP